MVTVEAQIEVYDTADPDWGVTVGEYGEGETVDLACWDAQDRAIERFGGGGTLRANLLDWQAA